MQPQHHFGTYMPLRIAIFLLGALLIALPAAAKEALVVPLEGAIGPATAEYVLRGLHEAETTHASAVVLRLDTPGGLDSAMRTIIRAILASPVPVLGYVAPAGARAASAGTYILYACSLAAMTPGTNLGAATPVSLFSDTPLPGAQQPPAANSGNAELTKVTNDAVAYIRGLATLHGRNADWAEQAVRTAASLSYDAALREHVIDLVAPTTADLLAAADGRSVLVNGHTTQLATRDAIVREIQPDWRESLLGVLTDPSLLYLLLLAGLGGVVFELTHPGIYLPGVLGTICLLLAGYGLNVLPIDYAGLALAIFGIGLIVAEAFVPAFGAFVLGGSAAFLIGSLMMFRESGLRPPREAIYAATAAAALIFGVALGALVRARRHPVVSGDATLLGRIGRVTAWTGNTGHVIVRGEHWNARATHPLAAGDAVRVVSRDGLMLLVETA